jgi:hypothetical protein
MNANTGENKSNTPDEVLRQKIEKRAYHIWLESGSGHGDHELHWLQAERELVNATNKKKKASKPN